MSHSSFHPILLVVGSIFLANALFIGKFAYEVNAPVKHRVAEFGGGASKGKDVVPKNGFSKVEDPNKGDDNKKNGAEDGPKKKQDDGKEIDNGKDDGPIKGKDNGKKNGNGKIEKTVLPPPSPIEKLDGDLLVVVIETTELRKDKSWSIVASQLDDFQMEVRRKLLGGSVYVTRQRRHAHWDSAANSCPPGEAFERIDRDKIFDRVFDDVEDLTKRAKSPDSLKVVLVWYSDYDPATLGSLSRRMPKSVLGCVWIDPIDDQTTSPKLKALFNDNIVRADSRSVGRLTDAMTFALDTWPAKSAPKK